MRANWMLLLQSVSTPVDSLISTHKTLKLIFASWVEVVKSSESNVILAKAAKAVTRQA